MNSWCTRTDWRSERTKRRKPFTNQIRFGSTKCDEKNKIIAKLAVKVQAKCESAYTCTKNQIAKQKFRKFENQKWAENSWTIWMARNCMRAPSATQISQTKMNWSVHASQEPLVSFVRFLPVFSHRRKEGKKMSVNCELSCWVNKANSRTYTNEWWRRRLIAVDKRTERTKSEGKNEWRQKGEEKSA